VQLAQAGEAPAARKVEAAQTRVEKAPERPAAPETRPETSREAQLEASRWNVLVGGFRARPQAQRFATLIEHRYRREFRGLRPEVVGRGPYRVEFTRLDERQAKSACETLSASGHHCSRVSTGA
jgi:hypothetical protein